MCVIFIKGLICINVRPITHMVGVILRILMTECCHTSPVKHTGGQNNVFPNHITFDVLL